MRRLKHIVEPESLLLLWQDPVSRSRYIVGRVTRDNGGYCFCYLPGGDLDAAREKGFKGYLAFPHFNETYRLGVMESFITRLPPRSREDFDKFLDYWHIDSSLKDSLSDFTLLGYTGAALPRDGFRFIPVFSQQAHLEFIVEVAGHRYQANLCEIGETVRFVAEPGNPHDPEAIKVESPDGRELGYVMHGLNRQFGEWLASGRLSGEIVRINEKLCASTEPPTDRLCWCMSNMSANQVN